MKINIFYLGFLLGNFTLKEVGRPPKVGILYEMGKTVQGGFSGPGKIGYTLQEVLWGGSDQGKWSGHQKKKSFINKAIEALILSKQDSQLLLRLDVPLGESSKSRQKQGGLQKREFSMKLKNVVQEGFSEFINFFLIFLLLLLLFFWVGGRLGVVGE